MWISVGTVLTLSFILLQDNVLNIINQIMDECIPHERANRDFCVKFPEEIRHDNLAGQLWFGAEVSLSPFLLVGIEGPRFFFWWHESRSLKFIFSLFVFFYQE